MTSYPIIYNSIYRKMTHRSLLLISFLILSIHSADISFLSSAWSSAPASISMDHILNIFRHQLGEATPKDLTASADYLKQLVHTEITDKIVVYLMDSAANTGDIGSVPITNYVSSMIPSKIWKNIATYAETHPQVNTLLESKFTIVNGDNITLEDIKKIDIPETAKVVIWGRAGEHQKIKNHFTAKRVLQSTTTDSSYLIKFFFSVMFIIITFGILLSISNMKNQRDTLLYAKFVADVGAR